MGVLHLRHSQVPIQENKGLGGWMNSLEIKTVTNEPRVSKHEFSAAEHSPAVCVQAHDEQGIDLK